MRIRVGVGCVLEMCWLRERACWTPSWVKDGSMMEKDLWFKPRSWPRLWYAWIDICQM
jgi:hypothetical protein